MDTLELTVPVRTPDGQEILPALRASVEEALAEVLASRPPGSGRAYPLLGHGSMTEDVHAFMREGPYENIFAEVDTCAAVTALMGMVRYPPLILDCLDWFKENDYYTYRHILLVFAVSTRLAWAITGDRVRISMEAMAGPVHDLGKICVPLEILRKQTPLTEREQAIMEQHTWAGYLLLTHILGDADHHAARVARDHHEKRDGSGYPRGLELEDRLVEVVAAADIYDALISPRPYRPQSYDNRTALEVMTDMAMEGRISPDVLRALVACNRSDKPDPRWCAVSLERRGRPPAGNIYGKRVPNLRAADRDAPQAGEDDDEEGS
jgi:HD-GYP domain-containing protein (c-di-GMP phosphodiesterase class II)